MASTSTERASGANRTATTRQSTETKASFKSTEFIVYVLAVLGLFIASAMSDGNADAGFGPVELWRFITFLTIGYMISRGLAKAGSREPYWRGGSNDDR